MGSVIQATWTVEFKDGLCIVNHLKALNGLQRVSTIPGVQPGAVGTPGFPAAAVLGLTRSREEGTLVLYPDVKQYS